MEYIKFEIDELTNNSVFCQYREITEEGKGPLLQRSFPIEKIERKSLTYLVWLRARLRTFIMNKEVIL